MAIVGVGVGVPVGVGVRIDAGTGSPEGLVVGTIGALWIQTDGADGEVLWRKTSGSGATGWTTYGIFGGIARVGKYAPQAGAALFGRSDLDQTQSGNYALLQDNQGNTFVNAVSTKKVGLRVNNVEQAFINTTGFVAIVDVDATGGYRQTIDGWFQENVAASQTDVALTRLATTTEVPTRWIAVRSGSVTGVNVKANAPRSAGTLTIKVFKNGAQLGTLTAVLDGTNTTFKATTQAKDVDTFVAGDELELTITTDAGWLPTTADIRAALEIET